MDIKKLRPSGRYKSGLYKVTNLEKYIGDHTKIIYRSSYELRFCQYCDSNPKILKWSSEPLKISYYSHIDQKSHFYFVDYWIKTDEGIEYLIEVKPTGHLDIPVLKGSRTLKKIKNYNEALKTYIVNKAKFEAAQKFTEQRGWKFMIITEKFLF